jgi:hypothetical protein
VHKRRRVAFVPVCLCVYGAVWRVTERANASANMRGVCTNWTRQGAVCCHDTTRLLCVTHAGQDMRTAPCCVVMAVHAGWRHAQRVCKVCRVAVLVWGECSARRACACTACPVRGSLAPDTTHQPAMVCQQGTARASRAVLLGAASDRSMLCAPTVSRDSSAATYVGGVREFRGRLRTAMLHYSFNGRNTVTSGLCGQQAGGRFDCVCVVVKSESAGLDLVAAGPSCPVRHQEQPLELAVSQST